MRVLVLSVSVLSTACFGATCAIAQTGQWGEAEDQTPPYRTHMDRRHGNDHVYPDRGAVLREVPHGAIAVNYAGLSYRFAGGVWYERVGPAYMVVAPPIGLVVPRLPAFATTFDSGGKAFLYANDAFYRPRPDLGGYEVVNDPDDLAAEASQASVAPERSQPSVAPEPSQAPVDVPPSRVASVAPTAPPPPAEPPVQVEAAAVPPAAPVGLPASDAPPPANPTGIAIQPHNGQSLDQQATDRYECYRFAVGQTGFDPLASNGGKPPAQVAQGDAEYSRAQAACLQGRGYTVR